VLIAARNDAERIQGTLAVNLLAYQMLMSPIAVAGYAQEFLGRRRRWR
jgi:hypothetical protein